VTNHVARYDAFCALLALPDDPALPPRERRDVFAGDPNRRETLKRAAERAYLRWRHLDAGRDESAVVSVRRGVTLKLAQRTA
jgi:hypothetical protein